MFSPPTLVGAGAVRGVSPAAGGQLQPQLPHLLPGGGRHQETLSPGAEPGAWPRAGHQGGHRPLPLPGTLVHCIQTADGWSDYPCCRLTVIIVRNCILYRLRNFKHLNHFRGKFVMRCLHYECKHYHIVSKEVLLLLHVTILFVLGMQP